METRKRRDAFDAAAADAAVLGLVRDGGAVRIARDDSGDDRVVHRRDVCRLRRNSVPRRVGCVVAKAESLNEESSRPAAARVLSSQLAVVPGRPCDMLDAMACRGERASRPQSLRVSRGDQSNSQLESSRPAAARVLSSQLSVVPARPCYGRTARRLGGGGAARIAATSDRIIGNIA